jgi:hypothetical protein
MQNRVVEKEIAMRNEPAEILRQFLDSAFLPARAESLTFPDAVFVDHSPTGNAVRRASGSGTLVGKRAFLDATSRLLQCTSSGELIVNSLFSFGASAAGFGTMVRCKAPDPTETSAPESLWVKVATGRIRFLQYMEFYLPHDVRSTPAALRSRPTLVAVNPDESVEFLTYQR